MTENAHGKVAVQRKEKKNQKVTYILGATVVETSLIHLQDTDARRSGRQYKADKTPFQDNSGSREVLTSAVSMERSDMGSSSIPANGFSAQGEEWRAHIDETSTLKKPHLIGDTTGVGEVGACIPSPESLFVICRCRNMFVRLPSCGVGVFQNPQPHSPAHPGKSRWSVRNAVLKPNHGTTQGGREAGREAKASPREDSKPKQKEGDLTQHIIPNKHANHKAK